MATADARDYVLAFESNKAEAAQIAKTTATKLQNRETTLIEVVQALGEYINDEDDKIRTRAVSYLTAVISALPPKFLSRQQIQVLNEFLCERIEDGGALEGLSKLESSDRFTKEMAQTVVRALFLHFEDLRSQTQSIRYKVFTLMNDLLNDHRKAVREMGDDSLVGIVKLVAGEKDPRNLMLVFSMLRVMMVEWDITKHVDILFDAVYAYFPITFRPPPNDPYGITAQDLKDRLKECLASTGTLAPSVFPNLLDRLDSTSDTVKKDVIQAFAACGLNYDVATMNQYSITLWDALKFEILQAQEPFLADEALVALKNIAICLSNSTNHSPTASPLVTYLKPINKECLEHLQEPASRQAKASGDILKAVASATMQSFEVVLKSVGPALLSLHQSSDGILAQRAVLEVTNKLFEAAIEVYGSWTTASLKNAEGKESLLTEFKDKLVAIYSQALMGTVKEEVSFRLTAAKGILLLSQMRSLLQDNEIGLFVQYFNEIVLDEESYGRDELKRTSMTALAQISQFKARLITDITFPAFLARLPDNEQDAAVGKDYHAVLEGLAEISIGKELFETLVRRLLNKLDILLLSEERKDYPYTCAILSTVYYVLNRSVKDSTVSLDSYYDRVIVGLAKKSVASRSGAFNNEAVLDMLGRIMNLIARHSAQTRIQQTTRNIYVLYRDSSTSVIEQSEAVFFDPPASAVISTWLLASLPRDVNTGVLQASSIPGNIDKFINIAENSNSSALQYSCLRQIALYINKHLPTSNLTEIDQMLSRLYTGLTPDAQPKFTDFTIRLIFITSKALVLRLAPKTNHYLEQLIALLDSSKYAHTISSLAAAGFTTILANDDVLSKQNYAQIRLLAPQRVFQTLVPMISSRFREAQSSTEKENYLIAMSGILGTVSSNIVMPELPTLLPLLLQSLDISDQSVKVATLETLAVVITSNPAALEESGHLPALVKRLLTTAVLVKQKKGVKTIAPPSLPRVRHLAAKCITLLPKHITGSGSAVNPLLALKREVLQGLMGVLDDPKRDVRKEGVDARAAWLRGVDDIDEDEDDA